MKDKPQTRKKQLQKDCFSKYVKNFQNTVVKKQQTNKNGQKILTGCSPKKKYVNKYMKINK